MNASLAVNNLLPVFMMIAGVILMVLFVRIILYRRRIDGSEMCDIERKALLILSVCMCLVSIWLVTLSVFDANIFINSPGGWHPLHAAGKLLELFCRGCAAITN